MNQTFRDRLQQQLLAAKGKSGWAGLARAVSRKGVTFDARKLRRLAGVDRQKINSLTFKELEALADYFSSIGKPISLQEGASVLDYLTKKPILYLLPLFRASIHDPIGSKRSVVSSFDLRALFATLVDTSQRSSLDMRDIITVDRLPVAEGLNSKNYDAKLGGEACKWLDLVRDSDTPKSLLIYGSPRASHAAEIVVARLFGGTPFKTPSLAEAKTLPLLFCRGVNEELNDENRPIHPSCLSVGRNEVEKIVSDDEKKRWEPPIMNTNDAKTWFLVCDGKIYQNEDMRTTYASHAAIIVGQLETSNQTAALLMGLSGPDTFAAARCLPLLRSRILFGHAERNRCVIAVVKSEIKKTKDPLDGRELTGAEIAHEFIWPR